MVLGGIIWLLKEKGVNFSVLALGVDFLQIISMFSSFGFKCVWMIAFDWWTIDVLLARWGRISVHTSSRLTVVRLKSPDCSESW